MPINVLMVLNGLDPGGAEMSTVQLIRPLLRQNVSMTIAVLTESHGELQDTAERSGAEVIHVSGAGPLQTVRRLRRLVSERSPDVIHTALFDADITGRLSAVGTRIPVISSLVNTPYDPLRRADPRLRPWKLTLVRILDAATGRWLVDRFHSVSEGVAHANARALHIDPTRITVVERGRDTTALGERTPQRRQQVRHELGIDPEAPVILNLGRVEFQKGQTVLVDAVERLLEEFPDVLLLIAGRRGSASDALESRLTGDARISARVRVLGHRTDVGDLLTAADVLAISSLWEGTAGVALEAMALGVPVVSTDLEGLRGVLRHDENSWLVPAGDPAAMATGLRIVLNDRTLAERLADSGQRDFSSRFTLGVSAAAMASLYRSVVAAGRRHRYL